MFERKIKKRVESTHDLSNSKSLLVSILLFLAMIPALLTLSWPLLLVFLSVFLAKFLCIAKWRYAIKLRFLFSLVLLGFWGAYIQWSNVAWLSGSVVLSGLLLVVTLKWLEATRTTEYQFLTLLASFIFALSSLYLSGMSALSYLFLGQSLVIYTLLRLNCVEVNKHLISHLNKISLPASFVPNNLKAELADCAKIITFSLPFVLVLFLLIPRLQGPLWELGVVMGLPLEMMVDQKNRQKSGTLQLRSGNVSRAKQVDEPVIVAEFDSAVPSKSRLYWRGPIYDIFDGQNWQMSTPKDNRSALLKSSFKRRTQLDKALTKKVDRVSYEARLTTNGERWLYGLDVPYGGSAEIFISQDFQVMHLNKRQGEFNYKLSAYLEYRGGRPLTLLQRKRYLALPEKGNARLRRWSQQLLTSSGDKDNFIFAVGQALASGGYQIDDNAGDINANSGQVNQHVSEGLSKSAKNSELLSQFDYFFFEHKSGSLEQLNAALSFAFRAAGVPSRIVTGYRGGSLIALTNYVVVKEENAHVWLELWQDKTGWQRFEAKDLVKIVEPEKASKSATNTQQASKKMAAKADKNAVSKVAPGAQKATESIEKNNVLDSVIGSWNWLTALSSSVKNWVANYSPEQQVKILKKAGLKKVDWKSLLLISLLAMGALLLLFTLLSRFSRKAVDPITAQFVLLNKILAKHDLNCAPNECPQRWLQRLAARNPDFFPALKIIIEHYIKARYLLIDKQQIEQQLVQLKRDIKRLNGMI